MSDRGAVFESGNWNPTAGTGYPFSGQAFVYLATANNTDPSGNSGNANVPASVDTSPTNSSIYVFVSGTVNPYQSSSWYQWQSGIALVAGTPLNQSTSNGGTFASGNSLYTSPPRQNQSPFQQSGGLYNTGVSGICNVPKSESSITH